MKIDPKFISAPGGGRLVILTEEEYNALLEAQEDADDLAAAINARKSIADEGAIPADVSRAIRAGTHPIAAWRAYRNLSQAQLADRAHLTQAAIARIEGAVGDVGKPATRRAIAEALDAPLWAIEQGAMGTGGGNEAASVLSQSFSGAGMVRKSVQF